LIDQAAERFWLRGEVSTVQHWVLTLPDAVLRTHLHLALDATFHFFISGSIPTETVHVGVVAQVERTCTRMEGLLRRKADLALSEGEETLIKLRMSVLRALVQSREFVKRGNLAHLRQLVQKVEALPADEEVNWNFIRLSILFLFYTFFLGETAVLLSRLRQQCRR